MAKRAQDQDMESQLRTELIERTKEETINAIAVSSGIDVGQLYRFARAERTLRLPAASALAAYLGLELARVKQAANKPQASAKRASINSPASARARRPSTPRGAAPPRGGG